MTTRRALFSAAGTLVAASLAGCITGTSSGGDSPTETTNAGGTPATTGDGNDERTTRDTSHAGVLSIINDTDASRAFTVTIVDDQTDKERTFELTVAAGKQNEISGAYPIVNNGIVVHSTTIESDGTVLGEYDVRVFDYHKVHDVTATISENGVEWTTTIH